MPRQDWKATRRPGAGVTHATAAPGPDRLALLLALVLLGHLLVMAAPAHHRPAAAARHDDRAHRRAADAATVALVAGGALAARLAAGPWRTVADCALMLAQPSGGLGAAPPGLPLRLPLLAGAPATRQAGTLAHPPWCADPQALLQVFRL
jgi:hypothetical protein